MRVWVAEPLTEVLLPAVTCGKSAAHPLADTAPRVAWLTGKPTPCAVRGWRPDLIITPTNLPGVLILTPRRFSDARGFFAESWNRETLRAAGLDLPEFVQDNHSLSHKAGTLRGLHFQSPPHAQGKLVRCGRGRLYDVAVDIRRGSPTYGQWFGIELSYENALQVWIPAGFLHGFVSREPDTEIIYKCTDHYAPACDGAVRFDDPDLGIDWGIDAAEALVSDKDATAPLFRDFLSPFAWEGAA